MDVSTVESMVATVTTPVTAIIPSIAVAGLGIFALIFGFGFIPKLIKKFGGKG